ncbi:hypothetical protein niasHS_007893 [Heterodera schachtii]|uniref:polynucleotide adenylyltransferase n=1 Tax=Heterodera schachtii TaxID=97005 RepID=A0ABD2JPZ4_HETSC
MASKICLLFPNAPLSYLLHQFFSIYSKWDWARVPIMLNELTPITKNKIVFRWPPLIGQNPMTIITPNFPEQNTTYNVNKFTLKTIVEELALGNKILSKHQKNWQTFFNEVKIEEKFKNFAVIVGLTSQFDTFTENCAFQRSKIRNKLFEWANRENVVDKLDHYQLNAELEKKAPPLGIMGTVFGILAAAFVVWF